MIMWNWLLDCYNEGNLSIEDMEKVMIDDDSAVTVFKEFTECPFDFVDFTRDEVRSFLKYIKKKEQK